MLALQSKNAEAVLCRRVARPEFQIGRPWLKMYDIIRSDSIARIGDIYERLTSGSAVMPLAIIILMTSPKAADITGD